MQHEIATINTQFFKIICDVIDTNLTEISSKDYTAIIEKYKKQKADFARKTDTFSSFIKRLEDEEKAEVKKYKGLFANETSTIKIIILLSKIIITHEIVLRLSANAKYKITQPSSICR